MAPQENSPLQFGPQLAVHNYYNTPILRKERISATSEAAKPLHLVYIVRSGKTCQSSMGADGFVHHLLWGVIKTSAMTSVRDFIYVIVCPPATPNSLSHSVTSRRLIIVSF